MIGIGKMFFITNNFAVIIIFSASNNVVWRQFSKTNQYESFSKSALKS